MSAYKGQAQTHPVNVRNWSVGETRHYGGTAVFEGFRDNQGSRAQLTHSVHL